MCVVFFIECYYTYFSDELVLGCFLIRDPKITVSLIPYSLVFCSCIFLIYNKNVTIAVMVIGKCVTLTRYRISSALCRYMRFWIVPRRHWQDSWYIGFYARVKTIVHALQVYNETYIFDIYFAADCLEHGCNLLNRKKNTDYFIKFRLNSVWEQNIGRVAKLFCAFT